MNFASLQSNFRRKAERSEAKPCECLTMWIYPKGCLSLKTLTTRKRHQASRKPRGARTHTSMSPQRSTASQIVFLDSRKKSSPNSKMISLDTGTSFFWLDRSRKQAKICATAVSFSYPKRAADDRLLKTGYQSTFRRIALSQNHSRTAWNLQCRTELIGFTGVNMSSLDSE